MHKTALCVAFLAWVFVVSAFSVNAAEKKTIFNTESMKYESGTGVERCREKCGRKSDPDVKSFLSEGWKMESSRPKEVIGEHYRYVPCNTCKPHGCVCIGTEYVLQRDKAAPVTETKSNVFDTVEIRNRTVPDAQKVETSKNELDLLKEELAVLKRENALLKQEIESLRNQLRSTQK